MLFFSLGNALRYRMMEDSKLSFVINNKHAYEYLQRYEHSLAIRGEVSVILFDNKKKMFLDEFYLSNYNEGDRNKEIYLINN